MSPTLPRVAIGALVVLLAAGPATAGLDVVFVLDTTGSMGRELGEVQQRVRQLATDLAGIRDGERIRYGIVAYRDRGDAYVTLPFDLTDDVDAAARFLAGLRANGGGDGPESVVAAVATALRDMSWDRAEATERLIYLIGDAPPHLDYRDDPAPAELIADARRARIVLNSIGCRSLSPDGVAFFRSLAYATEGSYQHIGRVAAASPGTLTEALGRSATAAVAATGGRALTATWLSHSACDSAGILLRQSGPEGIGQSRDGDGLDPCTLEVRLPPGYALQYQPSVRLLGSRLRVELALTEGPGGRELYALSECPANTIPIDVGLGGDR